MKGIVTPFKIFLLSISLIAFFNCNDEPIETTFVTDTDGDSINNDIDNCPAVANPDQLDTDSDGVGDICDPDDDGDGILDTDDNCPLIVNADQEDSNADGIGDVCNAPPGPLFRCENGMAGPYPCEDFDLLSHIPISTLASTAGNPEGSDIWGWTDPMTGNEYALIGTTNSTAFVDISDPLNPIFLGRVETTGGTSFWRDVKVYNNFAFIVADNIGAHGMQVFDLTRLRNVTNPPETFAPDTVYTGVTSCHNIVINESEAMAYLVGCNTFSGGPVFVDISNPLNPVGIGGYADRGYTHDAQVVTYNGPDTDYAGREIFIGSNGLSGPGDRVVILDVTDKANVVFISDFEYPQIGYTHQGWFTEDQVYFIIGDELDEQGNGFNTKTLVFDFSDLDNPNLSSTYFGPTPAIDHNGYVKGNEFFLSNYTAGLRVLDITNISASSNAMTETGYFDTHPDSNNASFAGTWSVYPYFTSGNIVISDINRGLFVVRRSE